MSGEKRGFTPQAEVVGPPRNTHHMLSKGGVPEVAYVPKKSRVIMGINRFGDVIFIPLPGNRFDNIDPALIPHFIRGAERLFDQGIHSYKTVLHQKTTTVSRDVGDGNSTYRPEKKTGFKFSTTRKDIARERKDKELKRRLLAMGIDIDKLYLLLHSATHNQTLLENPSVKKKKNIVSKAIKARGGNEKHKLDKSFAVSSPFMAHEKRNTENNHPMLIKVKVSVESKKDQIIKKSDDSYLVSVKEKAERGQANQKVKEILASYFKVASKKIKLVKGGKKPGKIFEILK